MKFYCDQCNAKYLIKDDKVRGKVLRIRCKKCSHVIVVKEPTRAAAQKSPAPKPKESPTPQVPWFYSVAGQNYGPFQLADLQSKFRNKELNEETYVWNETFDGWKPVTECEPFLSIFAKEDPNRPKHKTITLSAADVKAAAAARAKAPVVPSTTLERPKPKTAENSFSGTEILQRASINRTRGNRSTGGAPRVSPRSRSVQRTAPGSADASPQDRIKALRERLQSNTGGRKSTRSTASLRARLQQISRPTGGTETPKVPANSSTIQSQISEDTLESLKETRAVKQLQRQKPVKPRPEDIPNSLHVPDEDDDTRSISFNDLQKVIKQDPGEPSFFGKKKVETPSEPSLDTFAPLAAQEPEVSKASEGFKPSEEPEKTPLENAGQEPSLSSDAAATPETQEEDEEPTVALHVPPLDFSAGPSLDPSPEPSLDLSEPLETSEPALDFSSVALTNSEAQEEPSLTLSEAQEPALDARPIQPEAAEDAPPPESAPEVFEPLQDAPVAEHKLSATSPDVEEKTSEGEAFAAKAAEEEPAAQEERKPVVAAVVPEEAPVLTEISAGPSSSDLPSLEEALAHEPAKKEPPLDFAPVEEPVLAKEEEPVPREEEPVAPAVAPPPSSEDIFAGVDADLRPTSPETNKNTAKDEGPASASLLIQLDEMKKTEKTRTRNMILIAAAILLSLGAVGYVAFSLSGDSSRSHDLAEQAKASQERAAKTRKANESKVNKKQKGYDPAKIKDLAGVQEPEKAETPTQVKKTEKNTAPPKNVAKKKVETPNKAKTNTSKGKALVANKGSDASTMDLGNLMKGSSLGDALANSKTGERAGKRMRNGAEASGNVRKIDPMKGNKLGKTGGTGVSLLRGPVVGLAKIERREKTERVEEAKQALPSSLDKAALNAGFKNVRRSADQCLQRHIKRAGSLPKSKVKVTLSIKNTGKVANVRMDREVRNTPFESCMKVHKSRWTFQPFSGQTIQVSKAFVLQ